MALRIRLARRGSKKRPFYSVVVAPHTSSRDGEFIEKLGTYNPLLPSDHAARLVLNSERITYWLSVGAQPSERVAIFLGKANLAPMPAIANRPKKSAPGKKAQERLKAEAEAANAPAPAEAAPAAEPAAE